MDKLKAVLDNIVKPSPTYSYITKEILQAVIDDKETKKDKIEKDLSRFEGYLDKSPHSNATKKLIRECKIKLELINEEIKELQAAIGRLS